MNFDGLYKFIGYSFVCLIIFFIVAKSIRFQISVIESLVGINKKDSTNQKESTVEGAEDVAEGEGEGYEEDYEEDYEEEEQ
jgi:hypothetical protein